MRANFNGQFTSQLHDRYRYNKAGHPTWSKVVETAELLRSNRVEFNILCVVSQANVSRARDVYRFFRALGVEYVQFIPLAEFHPDGTPMPFTISAEEYGAVPVRDLRSLVAGSAQHGNSLFRQYCGGARRTASRAVARSTKAATATPWWSITATSTRATSSSRAAGNWATSSWIVGRKLPAASVAAISPLRSRCPTPNARL